MAYLSGNVVYFDVYFTDTLTGSPVDPTTVTFFNQLGNGTPSATITYVSATSSSIGVIAKIASGHYQTQVAVPTGSGNLAGHWVATGTNAAAIIDYILVGTGPGTGTTFSDLIETVYRRGMSNIQNRTVQLTNAVGSQATSWTLNGPQLTSVIPGHILSCDMEVVFVESVTSGVATVVRGWQGSTPASHAAGAVVFVAPRFTKFDIGQAINDEIKDLSSPYNGLYRLGTATFTYNPIYVGYDLSDLPAEFIKILRIRYKVPTPYRRYPPIRFWEVIRNIPDVTFPSGNALMLREPGFPGMPFYVTYSAPFLPLVSVYDDVVNTPAVNDPSPPLNGYTTSNTFNYNGTVPNFAPTMTDIIALGALIRLSLPREIARNFMESQPEPRKAAEVPAGAVGAATNGLILERNQRIQAEADRLARQFPLPRRY